MNALDLSPNFAGTVMALANGIGVVAGMAAPTVVGLLAPNVSTVRLPNRRSDHVRLYSICSVNGLHIENTATESKSSF